MVNDREPLIKASLSLAEGRKFRRASVLLDRTHMSNRACVGYNPLIPVGVIGEPKLIVSNNWLTW